MRDFVSLLLKQMGRVKLTDLPLDNLHAVRSLFKRERVRFVPALPGWHCLASCWAVSAAEISGEPGRIMRLVEMRRRQAAVDLIRTAEVLFYSQCGKRKNPKGWVAEIDGYQWMREMVTECSLVNMTSVHLSCVLRYVQLPQRKPCHGSVGTVSESRV